MSDKLFFLVKEHTSERVVTRAGEPLILQDAAVDAAIIDLEQRIPGIGRLEALTLDEYFAEYHAPMLLAKRRALKAIEEEGIE